MIVTIVLVIACCWAFVTGYHVGYCKGYDDGGWDKNLEWVEYNEKRCSNKQK